MSSSVVATGDGLEAILASSVPDLQLDLLPVAFDILNFLRNAARYVVDTDGVVEVICELVLAELHEDA